MWEKILSTTKVIIAIIVVVLAFQFINNIQSCHNTKPAVVVESNIALKPVPTTYATYVPTDAHIHGMIENTHDSADPSVTTTIVTVIHTDGKCNTCTPKVTQITKTKPVYGLVNEPKMYFGASNSDVAFGYAHSFIRFNKLTVDALIGIPHIGLGSSYQLTNNFFIGGAAGIKYLQYDSIGAISSYNLSIEIPLKVQPVGYIGFRF